MDKTDDSREACGLTVAYLWAWRFWPQLDQYLVWFCALVEVENWGWIARDGQAAVFVEAGERGKKEEPQNSDLAWLAFPPLTELADR